MLIFFVALMLVHASSMKRDIQHIMCRVSNNMVLQLPAQLFFGREGGRADL